ncbi:hypothetical protein Tco_0192298 [Tanacetum coccineum]
MINQGVSAALAACDATRNGVDSHTLGTGVRGSERVAREMFPEESDKIERYVGGLPDMIHENIIASKPKTMQEAVEMATELMDKRVNTITERQTENKRKFENTSRNNQNQQQQQQNKRQNTGQAYTAGNITARGLAIWPRIVEADLQMLTTTTATTTTTTTTIIIRREMVAISAELKDTLKETAQN